MSDAWDDPLPAGTCPWCSAGNAADARQCVSCGAAIAQRDDLGGVVVPGVTGIDPNLLGTPASLASPMLRSQGTMSAINAVSHVNATLGLAAAAAILGQDSVKGMLGFKDADLKSVGVPSEAALQAVEKLAREEEARMAAAGSGGPSGDGPEAASDDGPGTPASDPWADLPAAPTADPWADMPAAPSADPWADKPAAPSADPWADMPGG